MLSHEGCSIKSFKPNFLASDLQNLNVTISFKDLREISGKAKTASARGPISILCSATQTRCLFLEAHERNSDPSILYSPHQSHLGENLP